VAASIAASVLLSGGTQYAAAQTSQAPQQSQAASGSPGTWPSGPACDQIDADMLAKQAASRAGNYAEAARLSKKVADAARQMGQPPSEVPNNDDMVAAAAAANAQNYSEALRLYKKVDAAGDKAIASLPPGEQAHFSCGWYHRGTGAVASILRSNLAAAQEQIGEFYEKGLGTEKDEATAARWYESAIADGQGHTPNMRAAIRLAYLYANGRGVRQDKDRAMQIFQRFNAQSLAEAVGSGTLPRSPDDASVAGTPRPSLTPAQGASSNNMVTLSRVKNDPTKVSLFGVQMGQPVGTLPRCSTPIQQGVILNLVLDKEPRPPQPCLIERRGVFMNKEVRAYGLVLTKHQIESFPWMLNWAGYSVGGTAGGIGDIEIKADTGTIEQMTLRTNGPKSEDAVLEALTDKFGTPRKSKPTYVNKLGATWQQQIFTWKALGSTVVFDYTGSPNDLIGRIEITSDGYSKTQNDANRSKEKL
jgi:TPR repeat protein